MTPLNPEPGELWQLTVSEKFLPMAGVVRKTTMLFVIPPPQDSEGIKHRYGISASHIKDWFWWFCGNGVDLGTHDWWHEAIRSGRLVRAG